MKESLSRLIYICVDLIATLAGLVLFCFCRYEFLSEIAMRYGSFGNFMGSRGVVATLIIFPPFMLLIIYLTGYYRRVADKSRVDELLRTLSAVAVGTLVYFLVALLNDFMPQRRLHYELILMFAGCLSVTLWPARFLLTTFLKEKARLRPPRRFVLVCPPGGDGEALEWLRSLPDISGIMIGCVCHTDDASLDRLPTTVATQGLSGVVVAPSALDAGRMHRMLHTLYSLEVPVMVSPADREGTLGMVTRFDHVTGEPLIDITSPQLPDSVMAFKRFTDVVVSTLGLIVTSPLILGLGLAVKLQSEGPMIYSQERIGYRRRPFMIHKLRSMVSASEPEGPRLSSDNDGRITPIGRFMRKYRLDELPNLWNVLVGEMSLVGPRPEREYYIRQIIRRAPHYTMLHQVRPGLTSWGMVRYGYASNVSQMVERLRYDILYLQNLSIEVDLKILFYTLRTIARGEGK